MEMIKTYFIPFVLLLTSCTFSINMMHTEGEAHDMVDETQEVDADVELPDLMD
jgi:hypothetical protein